MTHYIEPGDRFEQSCTAFLATAASILYHDRAGDGEARKKKAASKTKFSCSTCGQNSWAKPDAQLICRNCDEPMEPEQIDQHN